MKKQKLVVIGLLATGLTLVVLSGAFRVIKPREPRQALRSIPKGCVFRTVMGEERSDSSFRYKTPEQVERALTHGLDWLLEAQHANGGWGAGTHARQDVVDPHSVSTDPATTSMVAMALLRTGNTLRTGAHAMALRKALNYLLQEVESAPDNSLTVTSLTGTQIQTKLGANIDVILTAQFLSNILPLTNDDAALRSRVKRSLNTCVRKIQAAQADDGSIQGSGWAGVLQSSFATNALESAQANGALVDAIALDKAREFQKGNIDTRTGNVNTDLGAGVVLYSVSGSARASAQEAGELKEVVTKAKREGKLEQNAPVSAENLEKLGYAPDDARKYATAYHVYQNAKAQAQRDDVISGFGSNGGEEFLSYLQTGEGMIIGKDTDWKKWYDNVSGRLLHIQNEDGSWSGHHCITSPVFCTATCLLILSIDKDVDRLQQPTIR